MDSLILMFYRSRSKLPSQARIFLCLVCEANCLSLNLIEHDLNACKFNIFMSF